MVCLRDFGVGRRDLNPQSAAADLMFKSCARLEITEKSESVDGHYPRRNQKQYRNPLLEGFSDG